MWTSVGQISIRALNAFTPQQVTHAIDRWLHTNKYLLKWKYPPFYQLRFAFISDSSMLFAIHPLQTRYEDRYKDRIELTKKISVNIKTSDCSCYLYYDNYENVCVLYWEIKQYEINIQANTLLRVIYLNIIHHHWLHYWLHYWLHQLIRFYWRFYEDLNESQSLLWDTQNTSENAFWSFRDTFECFQM